MKFTVENIMNYIILEIEKFVIALPGRKIASAQVRFVQSPRRDRVGGSLILSVAVESLSVSYHTFRSLFREGDELAGPEESRLGLVLPGVFVHEAREAHPEKFNSRVKSIL